MPTLMRTRTSLTRVEAHWDEVTFRTRPEQCEVILDDRPVKTAHPPSLESLERRHDASDKTWVQGWLADDIDPSLSE